MERLGKGRHGREGRRLSEREVSESNLAELLYLLQLDVSTSLDMTSNFAGQSRRLSSLAGEAPALQLGCDGAGIRDFLRRDRSSDFAR